jgi:hypothetical protein
MGEEMLRFTWPSCPVLALALGLAMAAAVGVVPTVAIAQPMTGLQPAVPQPDSATLRPGLAVTYHFSLFRN